MSGRSLLHYLYTEAGIRAARGVLYQGKVRNITPIKGQSYNAALRGRGYNNFCSRVVKYHQLEGSERRGLCCCAQAAWKKCFSRPLFDNISPHSSGRNT